jgi:uncharacterized membrane protein (DUF373 family)
VRTELVNLLVLYLRECRVAVDFVVELDIVSTLREIVWRGVADLRWEQITAPWEAAGGLDALLPNR